MQTFESCKSVLSCSRAKRKKVRVYTSSMLAGPLLDIITTPYPGCWSSCNPYYKTKWQCMLYDYQTPDQGTLSIQLNSPIAEWLKSYHLKLSTSQNYSIWRTTHGRILQQASKALVILSVGLPIQYSAGGSSVWNKDEQLAESLLYHLFFIRCDTASSAIPWSNARTS